MGIEQETIVAMAVAAVAEEMNEKVSNLRVVSFREVHKSSLEQYIADHQIAYKKYQLGDQ